MNSPTSPSSGVSRIYSLTVTAAVAFCVLFFGLSVWYARFIDWNAIRLAPAAALLIGDTIYPGPDSGVLTGHIYTPLGALAFAPVAWLRDVSTMMSLGSAMALGYFALPFAVLARQSTRRGEVNGYDAAAVTTAALLLAALDVRLRTAATMVHAESPAVGLGGLAIVLAAAAGTERPRGWFWAGAFAVGAVLAKQTLLPTWCAVALAAAIVGRACLIRFAAGSLGVAAGLALSVTLAGDWRNLLYNCVWVPAHHPWLTNEFVFRFGEAHPGQNLAARGRALVDAFLQFAPIWWPAFALGVWRLRNAGPRSFRVATPLARTATLAAACAAAQFPLALASFVKVGGDVNVLDPLLTPLTLMLAALALGVLSRSQSESPHPPARGLFAAILIVLFLCNVPRLGFLAHTALTREEPNRAIVAYLRAHPGETYLPWNPLHTWVGEARQDHFEYGVFDRALAGRPVAPDHYRAYLPPHLRRVAVRKSQPPLHRDMYRHYLPGLRAMPSPNGLEGWAFYEVPGQGR